MTNSGYHGQMKLSYMKTLNLNVAVPFTLSIFFSSPCQPPLVPLRLIARFWGFVTTPLEVPKVTALADGSAL